MTILTVLGFGAVALAALARKQTAPQLQPIPIRARRNQHDRPVQ